MASPQKSRLGRGLGGLISAGKPPSAAPAAAAPFPQAPGYLEIQVHLIEPSPYQARREIAPEQLAELAESIRSEGLLQPIVVRRHGEKFQLIAGERRWRAFQQLKIRSIPARVVEASDASAASIGLIENLQREGLNAIEEALGFASLVRDFDLTQETAAERVGKSRASVANAPPPFAGRRDPGLHRQGPPQRRPRQGPPRGRGHGGPLGPRPPGDRGGPERPPHREAREGRQGRQAARKAGPRARRWRPGRGRGRPSRRGCPPTSAPGWPSSTPPRRAGSSSSTAETRTSRGSWRSSGSSGRTPFDPPSAGR
jgi:ParB/RepB/Spo0J family partition protein